MKTSKIHLETRERTLAIISGVFLLVMVVVSFLFIRHNMKAYIEESIYTNVVRMNERSSQVIRERLSQQQMPLRILAETLEYATDATTEEMLDYLREFSGEFYHSLAIIYPDGKGYSTKGYTFEVQRMSQYERSFQGESVIAKAAPASYGDERLNIFSVPVWRDGEVAFLVCGSMTEADFHEMINVGDWFENGETFVIDEMGLNIAASSLRAKDSYRALAQAIDENGAIAPNASDTDRDYFDFEWQGERFIAYSAPLGVNNWYLLGVFSVERDFALLLRCMNFATDISLTLLICILLISFGLLCIYVRFKRRIGRILFIDRVTGEKNLEYLKTIFNRRWKKGETALIAMDVDGFNALNIVYGSANGDQVLRYITRVFRQEIPTAELYRSQGDQFVAMMPAKSTDQVEKALERFAARIQRDAQAGITTSFTMSFGICTSEEIVDYHELYMDALIAKRMAKGSVGKKAIVFNEEMRQKRIHNVMMDAEFKNSLKREEFHVYYQPKYDMRSGKIIGAEALTRWKQGGAALISPADFIPCFERSGKIVFLDAYVLETVCRHIEQMQRRGETPPVSINLSRVHLNRPEFIYGKIRDMLKKYDVPPQKLAFEITESAFYSEEKNARWLVEAIHDLGCHVDMDDYGMGISGLRALENMDFDTIKLDRHYVCNIGMKKAEAIIQSTIEMVERLGADLVVEGVETKEQVAFLVQHGCAFAQGFYYSRPLPWEDYQKVLDA